MDERIVAPIALTFSEIGGSIGLVLSVADPIVRISWLQFAGDHFLITAGFWAIIAAVGYFIGPMVWRKRRTLASKYKFLATIWFIGLFADNTMIVNLTADLTGGVAWGTVPLFDLVLRSLIASACFWAVILVWHLLESRKQVLIPPVQPDLD